MAKRLWIAVGFAAGYVVGSAAGRKQYERIKATAKDLWERPEVQRTVQKVDTFVGDKAPVAHDLGAALVESVSDNAPQASDDAPATTDEAPATTTAPKKDSTSGTSGSAGATS